jgi:hypothetical protein
MFGLRENTLGFADYAISVCNELDIWPTVEMISQEHVDGVVACLCSKVEEVWQSLNEGVS